MNTIGKIQFASADLRNNEFTFTDMGSDDFFSAEQGIDESKN